jgi:hypothetical protein
VVCDNFDYPFKDNPSESAQNSMTLIKKYLIPRAISSITQDGTFPQSNAKDIITVEIGWQFDKNNSILGLYIISSKS